MFMWKHPQRTAISNLESSSTSWTQAQLSMSVGMSVCPSVCLFVHSLLNAAIVSAHLGCLICKRTHLWCKKERMRESGWIFFILSVDFEMKWDLPKTENREVITFSPGLLQNIFYWRIKEVSTDRYVSKSVVDPASFATPTFWFVRLVRTTEDTLLVFLVLICDKSLRKQDQNAKTRVNILEHRLQQIYFILKFVFPSKESLIISVDVPNFFRPKCPPHDFPSFKIVKIKTIHKRRSFFPKLKKEPPKNSKNAQWSVFWFRCRGFSFWQLVLGRCRVSQAF